MRLLIIEDNIELSNIMKKDLMMNKFLVDVSYNGLDGEEQAFVNDYDVILLDLNLPDKNGVDILKWLRSEKIATPVIIITAKDEFEERIRDLNLGADDYITKPFQLGELRARIQAVVRRFHGRTNPIMEIGLLTIDPLSRTVKWGETLIFLATKEFDILEYLALNYPNVISKTMIADHIYDETFDPDSSVLRVHFTRLRKKLMEASGQDILTNIRGVGYSLCIDLKEKIKK